MSCNGCSTDNKSKVPKGCKNNGNCGIEGCEKLPVFDWLSNMSLPNSQDTLKFYEVRFKNGRKDFYTSDSSSSFVIGDIVTLEASPGHDVGIISLSGELVKVQMRKKNFFLEEEKIKKIYRKSSQKDIAVWQESREKESKAQIIGRDIINRLGIYMKLFDVEFQGDGNKATFYYTADDRIDFRQLIRDLAIELKVKVEMRQVSLRQESAHLGGIGSCGRELCCSTWLTDFRKVTTTSARYQQLSLNPQKLSGQCGKLKCCLNYELDSYLDAISNLPKQEVILKTEKGLATFVKINIFKKLYWYTYKENSVKWYKLSADQVREIIDLNSKGKLSLSLEEYELELEEDTPQIEFKNYIGQDSLNRFDSPKKKKTIKRIRIKKESIDRDNFFLKNKNKSKVKK